MGEEEEREVVEEEINPEDVLGAPEPEADTEGEAAEPVGEEPTETESEPTEQAETEEPEEPALVSVTFERDGKRVSVDLPPEQAAVVQAYQQAAETTRSQHAHLQEKHLKMLEERQRPEQPPPQQTGEFSPEVFVAQMQPYVKDSVQRGAMSEDFAELYPMEAASGLYMLNRIEQVAQAVGPLIQSFGAMRHASEADRIKAEVLNRMSTIAAEDPEVFGELADPQTRDTYLEFLVECNVHTEKVMGDTASDFLRSQFFAFRRPEITELKGAVRAAADERKRADEEKRRNAGGAGGGGGARSKPDDNLADIREILGEN